MACHINYGESGASVADVNSVAGCDLRAAVQPEERQNRSGARARQTRDRAPVFGVTTTLKMWAMNRKNDNKKLENASINFAVYKTFEVVTQKESKDHKTYRESN